MIRIVDQQSVVVEKYGLCLVEGNGVLALVRSVIGRIPFRLLPQTSLYEWLRDEWPPARTTAVIPVVWGHGRGRP
jgi:hypothetical protein